MTRRRLTILPIAVTNLEAPPVVRNLRAVVLLVVAGPVGSRVEVVLRQPPVPGRLVQLIFWPLPSLAPASPSQPPWPGSYCGSSGVRHTKVSPSTAKGLSESPEFVIYIRTKGSEERISNVEYASRPPE